MGGDHGQLQRRGDRASGSSVLTPPTGIPAVGADDAAVPVVPIVDGAPCLCGHPSDVHRHWRPGSDCGECGRGRCTAYRSRPGAVRRLLQLRRWRA